MFWYWWTVCVAHQHQHLNSIIKIEIENLPTSITFYINMGYSESYSKPSQTSKTEPFTETVNVWKPLTLFTKSCILDIWLGSEYQSVKSVRIRSFSGPHFPAYGLNTERYLIHKDNLILLFLNPKIFYRPLHT